MNELAKRCQQVLRSNDRGGHTVPSPHLYPHQWAWDSAFAAIGWAHVDMDRATLELETLLAGAWPDGRIPHIFFHDLSGDYFPGPDFWHTQNSSTITQPPVWAMAARRLLEGGADQARIAAMLPAIEASHRFFAGQRDPLGCGAVAVVHPWESGLDNSPAWDQAMANVDSSTAPAFTRVDKDRVEDASQRPTDDDYQRYAALVENIAVDHFGRGSFAVYDPLMSTLLANSEQDLAWLSRTLGVESAAAERRTNLLRGIDGLWNEEAGRYAFLDAHTQARGLSNVLAAYAPIMLGSDLPAQRRKRLLAGLAPYLASAWPLPSACPSDDLFQARCYWRGPTWINMNWLMAPFVGAEVRERSIDLVAREGFREYYDPITGEGLGARDFSWTAALVLDWLQAPHSA